MRWQQGRATIEELLNRGALERVPANRTHADLLLHQARSHLSSASGIAEADPVGGFQLLYDAARKSLAAVLVNQGLRATSRGGHLAVIDAITAQLDPPLGQVIRPFDRLRRRRNEAEYPNAGSPDFTTEEVAREVGKVQAILDTAARLLDEMSPF